MERAFLFILLLISINFSSCNFLTGKGSANDETKNTSKIEDFSKTFEGSINNSLPIVMSLNNTMNSLSGYYLYKSKGQLLTLSGTIDENGNFEINEYNDKGSITGIFIGQYTNSVLNGYWKKPDGSKQLVFLAQESSESINSYVKEKTSSQNISISGIYEFENYGTYDGENQVVSSGSIEITVISTNEIKFEISTGGISGCDGFLDGSAILKNGIWVHSSNDCGKLTFKFSQNSVVVKEDECMMHGASCFFEGTYKKTK